jgi:hypothetical protein
MMNIKKIVFGLFCTGALVVTMGADSSGCSSEKKSGSKVKTVQIQTIPGDSSIRVSKKHYGTWKAGRSFDTCRWTVKTKAGRTARGGRGRGGSNSVVLSANIKSFGSTNCGPWTKNR